MSAADHVTLPAGLHAPALARAWLGQRITGQPPHLLEDALLVTSELVTNAVRHGLPPIELALRDVPGGVRITVSDASAQLPTTADAPVDAERSTGRGLLIVAATASSWGVARPPAGGGKSVWAELVR